MAAINCLLFVQRWCFYQNETGKKFDKLQHLSGSLMKTNIRVKLPNFWMLPSHDLVTLQIIQTILLFLQN